MSSKTDGENLCPECKYPIEENQSPIKTELTGDSYGYLWQCRSCWKDFYQWYKLVWEENVMVRTT